MERDVALVAGGTGNLGTRVVRLLRARGAPVRVLTRDPARAANLAGGGVEVVTGDVRDPKSLANALAGVTTVISAVQGFAGPGKVSPATVDAAGNDNLIDAAGRAGVERFVLLSAVGANADHPMSLFRAKHHAEEHLRASALQWTIVRPTAYMETWADLMSGMLRSKGKMLVFGRGENPINFVSVDDVAAIVERAAAGPGLSGRTLSVGGPDDVTFNEFAGVLRDITGVAGPVAHVPRAALRVMSVVMRPLKPELARMARASLVMDTDDMTFDGSSLPREFPDIPVTDLTTALKRRSETDPALG
jgi:uncharacterized protein YbjT (DUF2867 family)